MADNEIKTLGEIKKSLKEANDKAKKTNEYLERVDKKFDPARQATLTAEQTRSLNEIKTDAVNELRKTNEAITKLNLEQQIQEGFFNGVKKFLGIDFVSEAFRRLDKVGQGFGEIKKGFKDLGKALALDKLGKKVGGFWDFLKKIFAVGLATVGFIKFLEGWNKADEIFNKSANFGERLSAGLATVIGSFMGLTDGEINKLAIDINDTVSGIIKFLSTEFSNLSQALKNAWPNIKLTFGGFIKILEGDFLGGVSDLTSGMLGAGNALLESESMLAKAVVVLAGLKIAGAALEFVGAIKPIFSALSVIGSGIGTIFTALGGKAAFTALMATLAPTLSALLVPLGLALGAISILQGLWDGYKELEKSGDWSQALSVGLGSIVKNLFNLLTLGLVSDKTLQKIQDSISKFLDPVFEGIAGLFKSIWSWVKDAWDDATFNIKDFLGMKLTAEERFRKAEKDINEKKEEIAFHSTQSRSKRFMEGKQKELAALESKLSSELNAKKIDNEILSNASSYEGYLKAVDNNTQLTDEQKKQERNEMIKARSTGESFANFQNNQQTTNNMILSRLKPQTERAVSFSTAPTS